MNKKIITIASIFSFVILGMANFANASIIAEQPIYDTNQSIADDTTQYTSHIPSTLADQTPDVLEFRIKGVPGQTSFTFIINEGACALTTYGPFSYATYGVSTSEYTFVTVPSSYTFPSNVTGCFLKLQATIDAPYFGGIGGYSYEGSSGVAYQKWCSGSSCDSSIPNTSTHFISITPSSGSTVATTSSVGAIVYANSTDFSNYGRVYGHFTQDSAFACQNSGAVYDAIATCVGGNAPASPINIDFSTSTLNRLISGEYNLSQLVTFPSGGNWTGVYTIEQVSQPWYFLGLFNSYNILVSTTTHFTVGQLSPMDIARDAIASSSRAFASTTRAGIGAILASTTASLVNACNPFNPYGGFSAGDCITLMIWPGDQALQDDLLIINQTPPWGYVFRVITLLGTSTATTTLPSINYTFATSSPMSVMGNIHFDPFDSIGQAGDLVNEFKSDRGSGATVWTIMMPVVTAFIYLVLTFMIIHDITGIHWGGDLNSKHDNSKD